MQRENISEGLIQQNPEGVLKRLPFIDKRIMLDRTDDFLSNSMHSTAYDHTSTGGTSGEPFYFYIDSNRSGKEWAFFVDQWSRVGFSLLSKRATFRGSRIHDRLWDDDWITRERKFSSFSLTDEYLSHIWPGLTDYDPDFLYAYPSTAVSLCQFIERTKNLLPETIKGILLGSENIYDGQREYIERISKKKVFLWYGHSEKLVLAGECEYTNHYHAYPQYGYVEFINESGEDAKHGEFAEIVGTGFINTVMPFIRYRTGDYCTYLGDSCDKCGRNYHIFKDVRGRWTQEVLYGKQGNPICMSAINLHSNSFRNVFRFQFFQDTPGEAILRIIPKEGFSLQDQLALEKEFNQKFSGNLKVTAKIVGDIPLTSHAKYRFIDQKIVT